MADEVEQPAEVADSIQERIAKQFLGDEKEVAEKPPEEVAEEAPEEEAAPDAEEVEFEGERYQVPIKIKDALLRQSDYTKKTQELAEQRKQLESVQEQQKLAVLERDFYESVKKESVDMAAIEAYLAEASKTDWQSMSAEEMFRKKIEIDGIKERRDAIRDSINEKRKAYEGRRNEAFNDLRRKAVESLSKSVPNWSESTHKAITESARAQGFTDSEIDAVMLDPRSARVLWKAAEYDRLQASKETAVKSASSAPPMVKPGAVKTMPQTVKDDLALRKAQASAKTSSEKARIITKRLESRF